MLGNLDTQRAPDTQGLAEAMRPAVRTLQKAGVQRLPLARKWRGYVIRYWLARSVVLGPWIVIVQICTDKDLAT